MKAIQPVTIWVNGQEQTANMLKLVCQDDLHGSASFYYELIDQVITPGPTPEDEPSVTNTLVVNGNSVLQGQEYVDWNANPDINDEAYVLIAAKLNITLL